MQRLANWQLFGLCVVVWSTTWYAITLQISDLSPEAGVALRFLLAGAVVTGASFLRGERLRFTRAGHLRLALQGAFMFGVSYLCVYHSERYIVSGLVAVGYSASPLVTGMGAHWLFGQRLTPRFVLGGIVGLAGIALIFWPEFGRAAGNQDTVAGAAFIVAAVVLSAAGSLMASRNRVHGLPFWPSLGVAMLYGGATCALFALLRGDSLQPPALVSWWLSLLYLSLAGSVVTFACYLTLQERIGPGPTSTIGVMTPLLALLVSTVLEGFKPGLITLAGAALAVTGNVLMLFRRA